MNFEELCSALSRNDPTVTSVYRSSTFPTDWGNRLGRALIGNTCVDNVSMDVRHGHIAASTSPINEASISGLLQYFREGQALQKVVLSGTTDVYIGLCLQALASNSNITSLSLQTAAVSSTDLAFFIINAPALRSILILLIVFNETVASALQLKSTVEEIHLLEWDAIQTSMNEAALSLLPSNIQMELSFHRLPLHLPEWNQVLVTLLGSPVTTPRRLCLHGFDLHLEATKCLVNALCLSNIALKSLMLGCGFEMDASQLFTSYMQRSGVGGNILSYELIVYPVQAGLVPSEFLRGSCGLRSLTYDGVFDTESFIGLWKALADCHSKIRLSKLECVYMGPSDYCVLDHVCLSIPKLLYLRELCLSITHGKKGCMKLAHAIWQNGSLQRFPETHIRTGQLWEQGELKVIQLVGERNTKLPNLLVSLPPISWNSCKESGGALVTNATTETGQGESWESLYPLLFTVALQSPRHAPNWMFMGLLNIGISTIGTH